MPTPCAVTGNIQSLNAANAVGAQVIFLLTNLRGSIPYVAGVSDFVSIQTVATADSSGNISLNLWGNDNISPAGTQYVVMIGTQSNIYNIVGSAWNLNTAVPAILPPPAPPAIPTANNPLAVAIAGVPEFGGNFTLPHSLGHTPVNFAIQLTSLAMIVFQPSPWDASNLYLTASGGGITGNILIW